VPAAQVGLQKVTVFRDGCAPKPPPRPTRCRGGAGKRRADDLMKALVSAPSPLSSAVWPQCRPAARARAETLGFVGVPIVLLIPRCCTASPEGVVADHEGERPAGRNVVDHERQPAEPAGPPLWKANAAGVRVVEARSCGDGRDRPRTRTPAAAAAGRARATSRRSRMSRPAPRTRATCALAGKPAEGIAAMQAGRARPARGADRLLAQPAGLLGENSCALGSTMAAAKW
jgi:hypothetical protein